MQTLIELAGGVQSFDSLALEALLPNPMSPPVFFDSVEERSCFVTARLKALLKFETALPTDRSNAVLRARTHGLLPGERVLWWKRCEATPGWVVTPFSTIRAERASWLRALQRVYNQVHGKPLGPCRLKQELQAAIDKKLAAQAAAEVNAFVKQLF